MLRKSGSGWDTLKIKNLMLADYKPNPADDIPYRYSIQEIGYHDADGDHWKEGQVLPVLAGYSMSELGGAATKTGNAESGAVGLGTTASTITIHNETPTELSFTKIWRKNGFPLAWQEPITI